MTKNKSHQQQNKKIFFKTKFTYICSQAQVCSITTYPTPHSFTRGGSSGIIAKNQMMFWQKFKNFSLNDAKKFIIIRLELNQVVGRELLWVEEWIRDP